MISTARFTDPPDLQQQPRRVQHALDAYTGSSEHPRLEAVSQQQRSSPPTQPFNFDFRLPADVLAGVKPSEQAASRQHHPLHFNLSSFQEPARNYSYAPAPLQIPAQPLPASDSPSTYVPSATSTLESRSYLDFHQSSDSHSLSPSPLERTAWTDQSSSSLSRSPHDGNQTDAVDLSFDSRLPQLPFNMAGASSQPSLLDPRPSGANRRSSPKPSPRNSPEFFHPKIGPNGLAEDQPPTAQGKMRTRVYVACLQCRSRKIRCDGGKPKCLKCTRRSSECQYDAAPKRRGPDKTPGARQRTSKKAKAAKEEALKKAEEESGDLGDAATKGGEEDEGPGNAKKRRKRSSGSLTWPPSGGEQGRRSPVATAGAVSPVNPRGTRGLPVTFDPLQDLPNGARDGERQEDPLFTPFVGVRPQPSISGRMPVFFGLDSGTSAAGSDRVPEPPPVGHPGEQQYRNLMPHLGASYFPHAHIRTMDEEEEDQKRKRKWEGIGSEPSLEFSRKTWWDNLLAVYSPDSDRSKTALEIHGDLQFLFKSSNYFLSFFNVPLFFTIFCNPVEREKMQPSLVLAGLALATFMRSNEINLGNAGRMRALWLRDAAQSALEASFNARWIEPTLAQAAFLLALFEVCAHPHHSSERSNSAMVLLDTIVRALGLTSLDANHPDAAVFSPREVPTLLSARTVRREGCSCNALTLGQNSRSSQTHTPLWAATAAWNPDWTVPEIRKEESRRLCWSTLQLAAGHTAHAAAFSLPTLDFYCLQPGNYAILFPGETLMQAPTWNVPDSGKETVWALYARAMLLWNSCLRMRADDITDDERAAYAVGAWLESTVIEEALDAHTCGCDQAFMYQGREFLFITRMCISYEFRRFIPHPESDVNGLFNRKKAMAWLVRQSGVAKRIMHGLHTVTGQKNNVLAQRPFFVWWFQSIVARSLMLFSCDPSLLIALEVCQSFLPPIEYLSCLWPCREQRARFCALHERLTQACHSAGVRPPPPPNFDILAPGSPPMAVI